MSGLTGKELHGAPHLLVLRFGTAYMFRQYMFTKFEIKKKTTPNYCVSLSHNRKIFSRARNCLIVIVCLLCC